MMIVLLWMNISFKKQFSSGKVPQQKQDQTFHIFHVKFNFQIFSENWLALEISKNVFIYTIVYLCCTQKLRLTDPYNIQHSWLWTNTVWTSNDVPADIVRRPPVTLFITSREVSGRFPPGDHCWATRYKETIWFKFLKSGSWKPLLITFMDSFNGA